MYRKWLMETARLKGLKIKSLAVIFCSDSYLLQLNQSFLHHNFYTDVLTFDAGQHEVSPGRGSSLGIEGDIFISVDRVKENANYYDVPFNEELARVVVHGLFHLLGYMDATVEEQVIMRREEDLALCLLKTYL